MLPLRINHAMGVKEAERIPASNALLRRPRRSCRTAAFFTMLLTAALYGGSAFGQVKCDDSWKGENGKWSVDNNWTQGKPGEQNVVCLTNGKNGQNPLTTYLDQNATVAGLSIGGNNKLNLWSNSVLNVIGTVDNAGEIWGSGTLGVETLNNTGVIDANGASTLILKPHQGGPQTFELVNAGTMKATVGGTLVLENANIDNFKNINGFGLDQRIIAESSDIGFGGPVTTVGIKNSTLNGGILETIGNGKIILDNSTMKFSAKVKNNLAAPRIFNNSQGVIEISGTTTLELDELRNAKGSNGWPDGQILVDPGSELRFSGKIDNGGIITLLKGSRLRLMKTVDLKGGGTLIMGPDSSITATGRGNALNNQNSIIGAGSISNIYLNNSGNIEAAGVLSLTMDESLVPDGPGAINTGKILALPGSRLSLSGVYQNVGGNKQGLIEAVGMPGLLEGELQLTGATIEGGSVATLDGTINMVNTTLSNGTLTNNLRGTVNIGGLARANHVTFDTDVYNLGQLTVNDGAQLVLEAGHTYSNSGTTTIDATANGDTYLVISSSPAMAGRRPVELTGNGTVKLTESALGTSHITGSDGAETLINENNTIEGAGMIDDLHLINRGTITANDPNKHLIVKPKRGHRK
jgi:hypothetical protein